LQTEKDIRLKQQKNKGGGGRQVAGIRLTIAGNKLMRKADVTQRMAAMIPDIK
jgi:hypothetical protein